MKHIWVLLILAFCLTGNADKLAVTFDDLPGQQVLSADKQRNINQRILGALDEFHAPAIGFVNEGKLYQTNQALENIAILDMWIAHGQTLGNHTYSHDHLSDTPLDSFEQDVIKGSIVSRKLMHDARLNYQYFRHPFLDTGSTSERRHSFETFLGKQGYVIAPVTIDTDDWQFNQQLIAHPESKSQIIKAYLEHTRKKFDFYKKASQSIFGRNIQHIWLLHVNELNAIAIHDLLKIAKTAGYEFITIEDALKDKAYAEPNRYYSRFGVSWLYRWDFTRGKVVDWSKEPEPVFAQTDCFIVVEKNNIIHKEGDCETRYAPESTFKVPLSVIGFNSGILKDHKIPEWSFREGYDDFLKVWKSPHNPRTWMRDSCVWYSQVLTKELGMDKFKEYIVKLNYGNQDLSGDKGKNNGLTHAWLSGSLQISPIEQVEFLKKLSSKQLPASFHSHDMTKNILYKEELFGGWKLFGKTGNGRLLTADRTQKTDIQHGWFVGWIERDGRKIVFARHVVDTEQHPMFASFRAKSDATNRLFSIIESLENEG